MFLGWIRRFSPVPRRRPGRAPGGHAVTPSVPRIASAGRALGGRAPSARGCAASWEPLLRRTRPLGAVAA